MRQARRRAPNRGLPRSMSSAPDLILLDIGLPGMDGLETLKRIEKDKSIPVIFLTARRRELDEVSGVGIGGARLYYQAL